MPTKDEHVAKATGNEAFINKIPTDSQAGIDWTLVVTFYVAVHYVEAYLDKQWGVHVRSHTTRDKYFAREASLKKIFAQYGHLKFFGYNARYEVSAFTPQDITDAAKYLTEIKAQIVPLL